jgi:hypothetical protein
MADIPTTEDLYAKVDEMFRSMYPDAPTRLDPNIATHKDWIKSWAWLKESILADEANRVYWATYPDAPTQIDPGNPDHLPYVEAWNAIAEAIRTNGEMVTGASSFIDYSHVTADLLEYAKLFEHHLGHLYGPVRDWLREAAAELIAAFQEGRVDYGVNGESRSFETGVPATPTITVTPMAFYADDGSPYASVVFEPMLPVEGLSKAGG